MAPVFAWAAAWIRQCQSRLLGAPGVDRLLLPRAIKSGLQRRLLLLLLLPLGLLVMVSIYQDYQTASNVALQKDLQLLRLLPLLADSVVAPATSPDTRPVLLLAPAVADFVKSRQGMGGFRVSDSEGRFLAGEGWVVSVLPITHDPELYSTEEGGITYRVAAQRVKTVAGELVVQLTDGGDPRQQWVRSVLFKVLLPNLILVAVAGFAVNWAVNRALRPLLQLKDAVESRSPRDLSAIDPHAIPTEVQPLVTALNRLFALVNAQAEGQRRFIADAAHQLRTPLAGLQAQVEAWALATRDSAQIGSITLSADQILKLRSATRRTSQLANQLLALSRADASVTSAQPMQCVDLKALCESILPLHLDAATHKRIDLGLETQAIQVQGYDWLLRELLGNLVDNAVKYTPMGGTITLRCGLCSANIPDTESPVQYGFLEVEDDGPGIAPSEREKALQRFYRLPGTTGEGNGLGLAIADEIARLHGAQLELGDGTPTHTGPRGLVVRIRLAQYQPSV